MKLSTPLLALSLTVVSHLTFASTTIFKPTNDSFATQVCHIAATEGLFEARQFVRSNRENYEEVRSTVTCNNMSLTAFATEYSKPSDIAQNTVDAIEETFVESSKVKMVAKNTNAASQLCVDAIVMGERAARRKHGINDNVSCNSKTIASFVASFADQEVVVIDKLTD